MFETEIGDITTGNPAEQVGMQTLARSVHAGTNAVGQPTVPHPAAPLLSFWDRKSVSSLARAPGVPTQTGDAWLLEPANHLAVPLAREGDPLPIYIEETDKNFTIGWTGTYRIDGQLFVYS